MKSARILLIALVALLACVFALGVGALNSGFQTWAVRRVLAAHPEFQASVGAVSIGLRETRVTGLRIERGGIALMLPMLEADVSPISAVLGRRVCVHRLAAKGWTLDFTDVPRGEISADTPVNRQNPAPSPAASPALIASAEASGAASTEPGADQAVWKGMFDELKLPVDLSVDGVQLEGDAILPPSASGKGAPVRAHIVIDGGGLGAGRPGNFRFAVTAAVTAAHSPVSALTIDGTLAASMRTPRTFSRLAVQVNAAAQGPKLPGGVHLAADLEAAEAAGGETYAATLSREAMDLASVHGDFSASAHRVSGTWILNIGDGDVSPFALGRLLPSFEVKGQGRFGTGVTLREMQVSGGLNVKADRLSAIRPELATVGAVEMTADFDLTRRCGLVRIDRLRATLNGSTPVLTARGLQSFAFNMDTGELQVADATRDIFGMVLQDMPVGWVQPWLPGIALTGGPVSGEFVASARNGGLSFRSKSPLAASGLSAAQAGRPLLRDIDLSIGISADFTPQGWQAEISPCTARSRPSAGDMGARRDELTLSAKFGRLAGAGQAIKATGRLTVDLPLILAQPGAMTAMNAGQGPSPLVRGDLRCDFTASLDAKRAIEAKLSLSNLAADPSLTTESLSAISADIRADAGQDGKITFAIPLIFTRADRRSDVTLAGTLASASAPWVLDAQITSARLVLDDLKILGAPFARPAAANPPPASMAPVRDAVPLWTGMAGQLSLALQKVEFMKVAMDDVAGSLRLDPRSIHVDNLHAGLSEGGEVKMNGGLAFMAAASEPYSLKADLTVNRFNPATIFRAMDPDQPPTVEGKFNVVATFSGSGLTLGDLAAKVGGDCQVSSKGGVFRMLSTTLSSDVQTAGKAAALGSFLGSMANAVGGVVGKHANEFASAAQAVTEFAKAISPIAYDQLSVEITRDATFNTVLKDFTLIAPELRLAGAGQVTYQASTPFLEQPLAMEFKLRARGHMADAMKYAGILDAQTDELGYMACNLPLKVKGTLEKPDASEVRSALGSLVLQRGGSLLDKFFGK